MAFPTWRMPFGRRLEFKIPHPERTAERSGYGIGADVELKQWPSRSGMAKAIRLQQQRAPRSDDWRACVKLTDIEGYN